MFLLLKISIQHLIWRYKLLFQIFLRTIINFKDNDAFINYSGNNWFRNNDSCQNITLEHHIVFIWKQFLKTKKKYQKYCNLTNTKHCNGYILTSLERFMSLRPLITVLISLSSGLALFCDPSVLSTERIFLNPKS